jgi:hypothetical protein
MAVTFITDIFAGATVSSGNLTLPSGSIVSYIPVTTGNPDGRELVFGLCENMYRAVSGTALDRISTSVTSSVPDTDILRRTYTFTVELGMTNNGLDQLNVAPE